MPIKSKNGKAFFERGSWYHRTQYYDENENIKYGKKGGYETEEEAERGYAVHKETFVREKGVYERTRTEDREMDFKKYLQKWLDGQEYLGNGTKNVYQYTLDKISEEMGTIPLCAINEVYLNKLIYNICQKKSSYGLKLYELFSMSLSEAFVEDKISGNVMAGVIRPASKKVQLNLLTDNQIKKLLVAGKCSPWYLEILLGIFGGLKKGEIYGLKFDDFDFGEQTVSIQRQVVGEVIRGADDKSICSSIEKELEGENKKRVISLPRVIFEEVKVRKMQVNATRELSGGKYSDSQLVCCQDNGEFKSSSAFNNALKRICRKAQVPVISSTDLRDMYAMLMLKQEKVSFLVLTGLMGLSSIEETYNRYSEIIEVDFAYNQYIDKVFVAETN